MSYELSHAPGNPRNSEGSFVTLKDGRLLFAYTRYAGKDWYDHCTADVVGIESKDGGQSWSACRTLVKNPALNAMSVSLLRLQDGRIAMFYCIKSAIPNWQAVDCRPWVAFSGDEGATWSKPVDVAGIPPAYLVVNNDRLIQLKSGRLVVPVAFHPYTANGGAYGLGRGQIFYCLSDDGGATWRHSTERVYPPPELEDGFQEPGVVELADGRLMSYYRTRAGFQYKAFSHDGGETWSNPVPAPEFKSAQSPLSIKRDPATGILYAVWNDWNPRRAVVSMPPESWTRTPLVLARSLDEGKTWIDHTVLENAPDHGYCYTAMHFAGEKLFLAYCCGGGVGVAVLQDLRIRILDLTKISPDTDKTKRVFWL